ncbi:MAG: polysaccharide biosynthesis C-terminal domain-containing protein [Actinobacteria bacterium]|nr:polysaccharide biosynthesis C-terminal domain-containing protein [Actinomycetota bacterium]
MTTGVSAGAVGLLARNSGGRLVTEVGGLVARMLLVLGLGRLAGARDLGLLALSTTVASLATLPAVLGVDTWTSVEGARDPGRANRPLTEGLRVVSVLAPLTAGLLVAAGLVAGGDLLVVLVGAGALLLPTAFMLVLRAGFAGADRLRLVGWGGAADAAVALGVGFTALAMGLGAAGALLGLVAGETVNLATSAWLYSRRVGPLASASPGRTRRQVLRESRVMAPFRPLAIAFQRGDALMIAAILGPGPLGLYGAATNVTLAAPMVATSVGEAMLPRLSRPDRSAVRESAGGTIRLLALISFPLAAGLVVFAPELLGLLYGPGFGGSVTLLRLLAVAVPLSFANRTMTTTTLGLRRPGWVGVSVGVGLGVNLAANAALLPTIGIVGAAWATVVSEVAQMGCLLYGLRRAGAAPHLAREFAPALAAAALVSATALVPAPLPASLALAALAGLTVLAVVVRGGLLRRLVGEPLPAPGLGRATP